MTVRKARHTLPFAALALGACSSEPAPPATTHWVCADGPRMTNSQALALPYEDVAGASALPKCTPSCGADVPSGNLQARALPTGTCEGEGVCTIGIAIQCKGRTPGPLNGYVCRCSAGRWSCVLAQQGGSICDGGPVD